MAWDEKMSAAIVKHELAKDEPKQRKHSHYFKDVSHLNEIDVYQVMYLFGVTDPCIAHAAKKLLCAGNRGAKDQSKDIQEAIDTLERYKEIQTINAKKENSLTQLEYDNLNVKDVIEARQFTGC